VRNADVVALYDRLGRGRASAVVTSGRYPIGAMGYRRRLADDITAKLAVRRDHHVLDLGCNIGLYHDLLAQRAGSVLGVDVSEALLRRARQKHPQANLDYVRFDMTQPWPRLPAKFDRILIYSVVHFLDSYEQFAWLLSEAAGHLVTDGRVLLGEVRIAAKYESFRAERDARRVPTLRDLMFMANRRITRSGMGNLAAGPPLILSSDEVARAAATAGFACVEVDQQHFHPFYNTCSDFILFPL
jgi:2-polyprenyl-3-methyl-5-hydroxy-6-metoxy-1,4-benzoquinol methylase